ncbi:MAG: hypothetical protein BRD55_08535 [Bacteroidetes bacterium SW_9_63_38]|nr:MAG: hypothetical protein BRD55_08535 [Bacteroidetes bacterium SW_9_63_38]
MDVRRFLATVGLLFGLAGVVYGQSGGAASKVTWAVEGDTLAPGEAGAVTLRASIADGWKMYAPDSPPPTVGVSVTTVEAARLAVSNEMDYTGASTTYDPHFGKEVHFFSGEARLRLPVSSPDDVPSGSYSLQGTLRFMVCTDEICLPPATESLEATMVIARP